MILHSHTTIPTQLQLTDPSHSLAYHLLPEILYRFTGEGEQCQPSRIPSLTVLIADTHN